MSKKIKLYSIVLASLLSLAFMNSEAAGINDISFMVKKFNIEGELPADFDEIDAILFNAQERRYTLKELKALSVTIEEVMRNEGYAFYRVVIPPQSLSTGNVTLKVVSFSLSDIEVKGNDYYDEINVLRSMPDLSLDKPINTLALARGLKFANYNSSKQIKVTFKQSEKTEQVKASINVDEGRPYNISFIANNAGSEETGEFRLTAALQYNNLWNFDHTFNASYTTSPDHADEIMQYGFSYNAPIYYLKGWLTGYYAKSDSKSGQVAGGFDISGSGEMYGMHYLQYLPSIKPLKSYQHWFDIGIDNRSFNNSIVLGAEDLGNNVRSLPISLKYKGEFPWKSMQLGFHIEWAKNLGVGSENTQVAYTDSRFGATKDWDVLRYGMTSNLYYHQWIFRGIFSGQYTDDALISGEQLGLGGTYSVRGYQERETSADSGNILKLEVHTPSWYNANLLTFFDYGHGNRNVALAEEARKWQVSSAGIGVRWYWQQYITFSLDWAFALNSAASLQENRTLAGDSDLHGSIMLKY